MPLSQAQLTDRPPQSETFEDASSDSLSDKQSTKLDQSLADTQVILGMALGNQFLAALERCGPKASHDLYASLANAVLSFLRAALTLEQSDLDAACRAIQTSHEVSQRARKKTCGQGAYAAVVKFVMSPFGQTQDQLKTPAEQSGDKSEMRYGDYSDEQVHAELVHAESMLMMALISFLADQSIICLVKGAFKIRSAYNRYKECLQIMLERAAHDAWSSAEAQRHFESGVRMGHGIFNLLMSYLPRRVLRFLEYVGFSGNRELGSAELHKSIELDDGLRSTFSGLVVLAYYSYVETLFGLGYYDSRQVEQLNEKFLASYPNSAFFLLFKGRYHQMQGQLKESIESYQDCIDAQDDWKQFHSICHWEIMWSHVAQLDWGQAAKYADLLRRQCCWSAASYTYQHGTFLYAQLVDDIRLGKISRESPEVGQKEQQIAEIMKLVPDLRQRYAGKTIPAEKFAIIRAQNFEVTKLINWPTLPSLEIFYIWNIFVVMRSCKLEMAKLLTYLDVHLELIDKQRDEIDYYFDRIALVNLLRGLCNRHLGEYAKAEECFIEVYELESRIEQDTWIVPHNLMELAIVKVELKQYDEAKKWIKLAKSNYTGYLHETIVHFRLHAASRVVALAGA